MATVVLPAPLRDLTGAPATLEVEGATAGDALREVERRYPGVARWVLDESGRLREHIKLFIGDREATLATALPVTAELFVVRAISGGRPCMAIADRRGS